MTIQSLLAENLAAKGYVYGTHRLVSPAETLERVERIAPALGITRVANVTGLDTVGLPVVMVCRPNSRSLSVSQGKGLTLDAAKASGLMESVESYHGERISLPLKLATYNELRFTHTVVDVRSLLWKEKSLYHDNHRLLWIEGIDLLTEQPVWVPYELVHVDLTLPTATGSGCFALSSNGLASGNHLLEAAVHAICEVVERHQFSSWLFLDEDAAGRSRVDLATVNQTACAEVLERFQQVGIRVAVWDLTAHLGIPAFRCSVADSSPNPLGPMSACGGMGCHPNREVALLRALTEAAQSRLTMIAGSRDDLRRSRYGISSNRDTLERWHEEIDQHEGRVSLDAIPTFERDSFGEDLEWLLRRLEAASVERVLFFDLTKDGLDIPVVRVVIPGLKGLPSMQAFVPRPIEGPVLPIG